MQLNRFAVVCTVLLGLCASGRPASAELVFLTSGRTMSVKAHRNAGETVVLVLRSGGEVACDRAMIARIEEDEVPYPEPAGEAAEPVLQAWTSALGEVPYGKLIDSLSQAHGVDPDLVKAVVKVESAYQPRARSRKGAMGLMQLMPATARQYSVRNPYDPRANLDAGIRHLASLLGRFDVAVALAAYNAGEGAVQRFGGIPPYPETRDYVRRILALVTPAAD
jgi:soluble lytic murein transglycosylase-like protein